MVLRQQQKDTDSQKRRSEAATDKDKENKGPPEDSGQGEVKADPAAVIKVNLN